MPEFQSPEEKLLKLIRSKDRALKDKAVALGGSVAATALSKEALSVTDHRPLFLTLNKLLIVVMGCLLAYIGYEFTLPSHDLNALVQEAKTSVVTDEIIKVTMATPKPYTYYTAPAQTRDIFESLITNKKTDETKIVANPPELTKNLKLVGIALGKTPEAVIEDLETNQTLFLHKGDRLKEAIVDDIQESKVILLFNDQRVEVVQ